MIKKYRDNLIELLDWCTSINTRPTGLLETITETLDLIDQYPDITHTKKYLLDRCGIMHKHSMWPIPFRIQVFETCILIWEYVCKEKHGLNDSDFKGKSSTDFKGFRTSSIKESLDSEYKPDQLLAFKKL